MARSDVKTEPGKLADELEEFKFSPNDDDDDDSVIREMANSSDSE